MDDRIGVGRGEGNLWATNYPLPVPGATSPDLTVRHGFLGGLKVLVGEDRAERGSKRGKFLIPTTDGSALEVTVRAGGSGTAPVIMAETNSAQIGRRVQGGEWIWVGLPLILPVYALFGNGGAIDILAGGLAFTANVRIFVNDGFGVGSRYSYSLASLGMFAFAYLAIALVLALLIL